ncbi:hypothetical protein ACFLW9_03995 [Chloroflexota bacterium]
MEGQTVSAMNIGTANGSTTIADLKLIMAEHIINQERYRTSDEVQSILAETKVGSWGRMPLLKKLKVVFSES